MVGRWIFAVVVGACSSTSSRVVEQADALAESGGGALQIGVTSLVTAIHQPPATATVRVDGGGAGANTTMALPQDVTRLLNAIGDGQYVGCQSWSGLMFEIVLYNRALSDSEVSQVESYLLQKWAP